MPKTSQNMDVSTDLRCEFEEHRRKSTAHPRTWANAGHRGIEVSLRAVSKGQFHKDIEIQHMINQWIING